MTERELIDECSKGLNNAAICLHANDHARYCAAMSSVLDLLMVELVGGASSETQTKIDNFGKPDDTLQIDPADGKMTTTKTPEQSEQQGDPGEKAKTDAANRREAGNSPW